jgi:NTE family protein
MGFGELRIPLKVVATNFHSQGDAVFEKGPLLPALAASSAIPALFRPVIVEGEVYIDGGITNPTPFDTLADEVDIVVAIDVSGFPAGPRGRRPRKVDVLLASSHIMQQSIIRAKALRFQPDILIRPNVEGFRIHDFVKIERILEASQPLREKLKSDLSSAIRKWSVACSS